jgi:hypothetical protein
MKIIRFVFFTLLAAPALCAGSSASAQCVVDNKTVFIDPQLVPRPQHMTKKELGRLMMNPEFSFSEKQRIKDEYMQQFQPIQMPSAGGIVLISPNDSCRQQLIPR